MKFLLKWWGIGLATLLFATACTIAAPTDNPDNAAVESESSSEPTAVQESDPEPAQVVDTSKYDDLEIVTLLPPDAIPSIDNPSFHTAEDADFYYEPDELVMGVVFNGDARAYSVPHLSRHEIVNDEVGGVKIAVTW